jgi:hypothetical protein
MKCPLCESRKAKRLCPAKATHICPVCCGTLREVEIDCPRDCVYLHTGREYESEKLARTLPPPRRTERLWNPRFLQQFNPAILGMAHVITQSRQRLPELVDNDVEVALDALIRTFETLDKGIYYESTPARFAQKDLFIALKLFLEGPTETLRIDQSRLTTGQILDCLRFLQELASVITLPRPKSRAFLDHLEGLTHGSAQEAREESRLILPAEM